MSTYCTRCVSQQFIEGWAHRTSLARHFLLKSLWQCRNVNSRVFRRMDCDPVSTILRLDWELFQKCGILFIFILWNSLTVGEIPYNYIAGNI